MNALAPAVVQNPRLLGFRCIRCDISYPVGDYAEGCPACSEAEYPASVAPIYSSLPPLSDCRPGKGTASGKISRSPAQAAASLSRKEEAGLAPPEATMR